MYKVGDEVLIKAKIDKVDSESSLPYLIKLGSMGRIWTEEKELLDCKTYTEGLSDAWNLLKKVYDMNCDAIEEIFGVEGGFYDVIRNFTYEDCRDKIEAYEKEKEIKVGDVVEVDGHKGVVVKAFEGGGVNIVHEDGVISVSCPSRKCKKTGKHLEVADLLRQIGE